MSKQAPIEGEESLNADAAPSEVAELKARLDQLATENARLTGRIDQFDRMREPRQTQAPVPQLTAEQYNELLKTNPAEAVKLAVRGVVQEEVRPMVQNVETKSEKRRWDERAETQFPTMRTDRQFQEAVRDQMKEMIETDGRHPDDPTLLYRAAQIASTKFAKPASPGNRSGAISGEAPSSGGTSKTPGKWAKPEYSEAFHQVFGMNPESVKRFEAKQEAKAAAVGQKRTR